LQPQLARWLISGLRPEKTGLVSCREHGWKTSWRLWGVHPTPNREWSQVRLSFCARKGTQAAKSAGMEGWSVLRPPPLANVGSLVPLFDPVDNCPIHCDFHGCYVVTLARGI
jgi:hypothetical protein